MAGSMGPGWLPWGRGQCPGPRVAAVAKKPGLFDPGCCRGGVVGSLGHGWASVGMAGPLGPVCLPWGCGQSPGPQVAIVGAWPFPWASSGCRESVAIPLHPSCTVGVWPLPWVPPGCCAGVTGPLGPSYQPWGRGRSSGPRWAAVEAWPVLRISSGHRGIVAGAPGSCWLPWGCCRIPAPRLPAVGV